MREPVSAPPIHAIAVGTETRALPVWSGGQPVVWPASDGTLLFATRRGIAVIDPAQTTLKPGRSAEAGRAASRRTFAGDRLHRPELRPAAARALPL
jgi:hypothetical protein